MSRSIKNLIDEEVWGDILLHDATFPEMDNVITKRFLKDYIGGLKEDLLTLIDDSMLNIIYDAVDNDIHVRNEIINLINQNKITDIEFRKLLIKHIGETDIDFDGGFAAELDSYEFDFDGANAKFTEEDYGIKKYVAYYDGVSRFIYVDLLNGGFASLFKDHCLDCNKLTRNDIIDIIKWYSDKNFKLLLINNIGETDIDFDNDFAKELHSYEFDFDGGNAWLTEEDYIIKKYVAYYDSNVDKFIYVDLLNGGFASLFKDHCLDCNKVPEIQINKEDVINIIKEYLKDNLKILVDKIIEEYLDLNFKARLIDTIGKVNVDNNNGDHSLSDNDFEEEYDGADAFFKEKDYYNNFENEEFIAYNEKTDKFICVRYFDNGFAGYNIQNNINLTQQEYNWIKEQITEGYPPLIVSNQVFNYMIDDPSKDYEILWGDWR